MREYDQPSEKLSNTERKTTAKRAKKRRAWWIVVLCAALAIILAGVLYTAKDACRYAVAMGLFQSHEYETAAWLFEELSGYQEADKYMCLSQYQVAEKLFDSENYQDALPIYESLGDLKSSQNRVRQCYYFMAQQAEQQNDLEQAITYYTLAEDFLNAQAMRRTVIYDLGHELFLEEKYEQADGYFAQLDGQYPFGGGPHFASFADAAEYLRQEAEDLSLQSSCYIGQMPAQYMDEDLLWNAVSQVMGFQTGTVWYDTQEKNLQISATYYPGQRIVYAWQTGDASSLSEEERLAYTFAADLVEQAKTETSAPLALEMWLHDWLCDNVTYSSPNMDIPTDAYLQLRELTCIGALLDGTANCQGYTDGFYLLATLAGLDVCKISGYVEEPHCWNGIWLDDQLYFVDVTADDIEEMDAEAKTYIWFNCAYDAAMYEIEGGESFFPDLAGQTDFSQGYYGRNECVFDNIDDAARYLLQQYKENGEGWTYAVVENLELGSDDLYDAVDDNITQVGLWSAQWTEYIEYYNGDTYLSIYWE